MIVRGAGTVDGELHYCVGLPLLAVFRVWIVALVAGALSFLLSVKFIILWRAKPGRSIFRKAPIHSGVQSITFSETCSAVVEHDASKTALAKT